jgi:hypothetical protein
MRVWQGEEGEEGEEVKALPAGNNMVAQALPHCIFASCVDACMRVWAGQGREDGELA